MIFNFKRQVRMEKYCSRQKQHKSSGSFRQEKPAMEGDGGDDDEDPDGRDNAMVPNEILAQQLLLMIAKKVPTAKDDDFLAPILLHSTTKVEEVRTKAAGIQPVDGIGVKGQDAPMVSSHSKIQQFLISEKVPVTRDDDILAGVYKVHLFPTEP